MNDLFENKSDSELIQVLLKEVAKSSNELRCAEADLRKAQSRLGFTIMLLNIITDRNSID